MAESLRSRSSRSGPVSIEAGDLGNDETLRLSAQ